MEWFHGAAQHNHEVISSFWLLCKTSEQNGLKGQHRISKNREGEACEGNKADVFWRRGTAINPTQLGEMGSDMLPLKRKQQRMPTDHFYN